jgi:hypothetical protein
MGELTARQWIHGCYVRNDFGNNMVVKEKVVTIDEDTREILSVKNRLTFDDKALLNPKRRIFVTKPQFRNHQYKKETEELSKVDMYICEDKYLKDDLKKILDIPEYSRINLRKICNSPYVYNADVSMEALVRMHYNKVRAHPITPLSFGGFDIEASVLGCGRINIITYITNDTIYTTVLRDFMHKYVQNENKSTEEFGGDNFLSKQANKKKKVATEDDIYDCIEKYLGPMASPNHIRINLPYKDKNGNPKPVQKDYAFQLQVCDTELECLFWIFEQIHREETDFIGIWNIDYDIPKIISRLNYYGVDPKNLFCHPSVPDRWKLVDYRQDKKKTQHVNDKWHWFYCTAMSQFIDSMLLYSRIRKTKRKQPTYRLDAISKIELGFGKMTFGDDEISCYAHDHHYMQKYHFCEYVVYNIQDALLMVLMEEKNHDTTAMWNLTGDSPLSAFSKQSVMLRDGYYKFGLENGRVFATTGDDMTGPYDHLLGKVGGAVLRADLCSDIGARCIKERPGFESMILVGASDLDYKAIYPSFKSGYGISKETKIATTVAIEGVDKELIEPLFGGIANPEVNAVWIGHDYFGLPNYEEMAEIAQKEFFHP